jgi:hypothetical protein
VKRPPRDFTLALLGECRDRSQSPSPFAPVRFTGKYTDGIDWRRAVILACPNCGYEWNHIRTVAVNRGGELVVIAGQDPPASSQSVPTGRGSSIWIEFVCKNNHLWHIHLQFHKGQIYAEGARDGEVASGAWPCTFWRD